MIIIEENQFAISTSTMRDRKCGTSVELRAVIMQCEVPKYEIIQRDVRRELGKFYRGSEAISWAWVGEERMMTICSVDERGRDEKFWEFRARENDVWFMMFPGSDTNLLQELVWLICNDLNYETARRVKLHDRYIAYKVNASGKLRKGNYFHDVYANYKFIESMTPRFIKTHIPLYLRNDLLNIGCKIVYVARNPRDVVTAAYEFEENEDFKFTGSFSTYWNFFQNDLLLYCPYWSHVKSAWNFRHHPNLLFIYYEQLETVIFLKIFIDNYLLFFNSQELIETINTISTFFGKNLGNHDVQELIEHLKKLQLRESNYSKYLNSQIQSEMNNWIADNCRSADFKFGTM